MVDSSSLDIPLPAQKTPSPPSVPSSQMRSLTLTDLVVPDEDKAEATRIKARANQAFGSTYKSHILARLDSETRISRS